MHKITLVDHPILLEKRLSLRMRMLTRLQQQFGKAEGRSHGQSDEAAKSPAPTIQYQRQQQSGWQLGRAGEREGHEHRSRDQFERVHVAVEGYHRQGPGT